MGLNMGQGEQRGEGGGDTSRQRQEEEMWVKYMTYTASVKCYGVPIYNRLIVQSHIYYLKIN